MCRNIKRLRYPDRDPTDAELHDAALQFVRKISGYRKPSRANQEAFDRAVREVAAAGRALFDSLEAREGRRLKAAGVRPARAVRRRGGRAASFSAGLRA